MTSAAASPASEKMALLRAKRAEKRAQGIDVPIAQKRPFSVPHAQIKSRFLASTDEGWLDLARAKGLRLPGQGTPCDVRMMRRWLRRLGLSQAWFEDYSGMAPQEWIDANPTWGLRAFVGLLLEELA